MGGNRPTVSQAEAWQPDSLRAAAAAWDTASTDIAREFDVIVQGVQASEDFWLGDSADAARTRTYDAVGDADQLARALVAASVAARVGADRIAAAKRDVVSLVQAMRELNFGVADDGTVTPPELPPSPFMSNIALAPHLTRKAAERTTEDIRQKLDALGATTARRSNSASRSTRACSSGSRTRRAGPVDRQVLAFDPQRASFIELIGDLDTAKGVGVLIPGMNTTILGSAENTKTATQFVNESRS